MRIEKIFLIISGITMALAILSSVSFKGSKPIKGAQKERLVSDSINGRSRCWYVMDRFDGESWKTISSTEVGCRQ